MVVPRDRFGLAVGCPPGRLGRVDVAVGDHDADGFDGVGDDGTLGWADDVAVAAEDEDADGDGEHAETQQEGGVEAAELLHERGGEEGKATDVDAGVEHHVDALVGDGRVDDDALARLLVDLDGHDFARVLVGDQGGNVGLDAAGAEGDDDDRGDVSPDTRSMLDARREGGCPEDDETQPVDAREDEDGLPWRSAPKSPVRRIRPAYLVFPEVLVRDDCPEDWGEVAEELEEDVQPRGAGVAKT